MNKQQDLIGKKYGILTVIQYSHKHNGKHFWLCKCDCGKTKLILSDNLIYGGSKSCGCQCGRKKHGLAYQSLYKIWCAIKTRCSNSNISEFKNYGGRGITVCNEWLNDPELFIKWANNNGYQKGLQIDRINNDMGYSPDNCRFVTRSVNCLNKSNNRNITYQGQTKTLQEWSKIIGKTRDVIHLRLKRGWSVDKAFTEAVSGNKDPWTYARKEAHREGLIKWHKSKQHKTD